MSQGRNNPSASSQSRKYLIGAQIPAQGRKSDYAGGWQNSEIAAAWRMCPGRVSHAFLPWAIKTVLLFRACPTRFLRMVSELDECLILDAED